MYLNKIYQNLKVNAFLLLLSSSNLRTYLVKGKGEGPEWREEEGERSRMEGRERDYELKMRGKSNKNF